ncbi:hypothetical protein SOCE26_095550 [Sorangium cellulosum]|uniref:DUF4351 domain-containing protein n=1 Tax=Sorangium cellulosum TaxID=56 RepID=A0A2L0F9A1_SORCE|nr:hypothetical protein [Sorangium cellulosum]AUX48029.1 hypothetical protein SOCE26_095550 [Sorangium cellulosum]
MGEADITLRHLVRRRPEDLVRTLVPAGRSVEILGLVDSQVTNIERRLDKALRLRIDGEPRVLHVEFCFALRDDVPDRIFEYLGFLFAALRLETPGEPVPPLESVAVVLSGRRRRLPSTGRRRIAWPGRPFSGAHFRVDAVYQRTVGELRARGSVLWLVFAPLARNATAAALRDVVAEIHAGAATAEERAELYAALLVMAAIDPWGHNLRKELVSMVEDKEEGLLRRTPIIGEMILEAERRGEQRGEQRGELRGEQRGEERGEQKAIVALLGRLFARRIGRRPTAEEERSIVERARAIGAGEVEDALLDLEGDALVRWLAEPIRRS